MYVELNQIVKASMDYARYKDKILMNYITDRGDGVFVVIGNGDKLAEYIIKMINSVDDLIDNL